MAMNPWVIFIGVMILSWIVSATMKSRFKKYSKIPVDNGMSGKEIAERMLRDNGIYDVTVQSVPGQLTDHYNPEKKTINLSQVTGVKQAKRTRRKDKTKRKPGSQSHSTGDDTLCKHHHNAVHGAGKRTGERDQEIQPP